MKEAQVLLSYKAGMKRRHIATSLRVVPHFVTNTILKVRKLGLDVAS
jgi:transposase